MFSGKVAVVTGASGAFGSAIAYEFAKASAGLILTARNEKSLLEVVEKCKELGSSKVVPIIADLTVRNDVSSIASKTIEGFGRVDILVNNAGVFLNNSLLEVEWEDFDKIFDVNCKAPLMLSKFFMPHLIKTKGCIVNISSEMTKSASPPYISKMSRGALDQLTLNLASEFAKSGVRINSVKPGLSKSNLTSSEFSEEYFLKVSKTQPIGGLLEHKDIADAVIFLCSPSASKITGQFIQVDGGRSVFVEKK